MFEYALQLGILDGVNPMKSTRIATNAVPAPEDTYAYSLDEVKKMLLVLPEPARIIVMTAAYTGLRKSEIVGLEWCDFNGSVLNVERSIVAGDVNDTERRKPRTCPSC